MGMKPQYHCPTCNRRSKRLEPSAYCQFCGAPLCPKCDPGPQEPCPNCVCQWNETNPDEYAFVSKDSGCMLVIAAYVVALLSFFILGCMSIHYLTNYP